MGFTLQPLRLYGGASHGKGVRTLSASSDVSTGASRSGSPNAALRRAFSHRYEIYPAVDINKEVLNREWDDVR